ncbi:MAG: CRP-like cAMP-binding protein [Patiriisocius sp.]|jgi:CRP-like cAMP-binding protein
MDNLISGFLTKISGFSKEEMTLIKEELQFRTLSKEEILLDKGETCAALSFIISGALYQYKIDADGNKNIIDLNVANNWVINHKSFTTQKPSEYTIQAYEESTICLLTIDSIHRLIAKSQSFLKLGKVLEASISRIDFFDNNYTPDEKYQYVLENNFEITQKFPLKLIASYLKITPETLSRVRNRFSKL